MSASPHLEAPEHGGTPAGHGPPTTSPDPASPPNGPRGPSRWSRRLAAGGLVVALLGAGYAVQEIRAADAAATAVEQREARAELATDLAAVREAIADPARTGQQAASALLRHQLLLIAGEGPSPDVGDRLVGELRAAADELDVASSTPLPERPQILPVATVDPIFARLSGLEEQAADLASTYRDAADAAEAELEAVRALEDASRTYADAAEQLPDADDPDTVAAAWRAERDRLEVYAGAVAAGEDVAAAAPLAAAHDTLVTGMRELADDALAALGEGDVDGYNALLDERLGSEDPFGFGAALDAARAEAADDAVTGPLEDARGRGLGLLTELEELRRVTPAQLAEVR